MNKLEARALKFLQNIGATQIKKGQTIDFETDIGNYEVKLAVYKTIFITHNQKKLLEHNTDIQFIVYPTKFADIPLIYSVLELKKEFHLTCINENMQTIKLSNATKIRFDKVQATLSKIKNRKVDQNETMSVLLDLWETSQTETKP